MSSSTQSSHTDEYYQQRMKEIAEKRRAEVRKKLDEILERPEEPPAGTIFTRAWYMQREAANASRSKSCDKDAKSTGDPSATTEGDSLWPGNIQPGDTISNGPKVVVMVDGKELYLSLDQYRELQNWRPDDRSWVEL